MSNYHIVGNHMSRLINVFFRQKFDTSSSICLYQLTFNKKTFYSNYGVFYEDLTSVCLRLDYELGLGPLLKTDVCSKLINCYTLMDPHYQPPSRLDEDESFEEGRIKYQGIFCPSLGAEFWPHSQSKIATLFPNTV